MNNKDATANKKLPINRKPNKSIVPRVGSNSSSGNLPTPIRAFSTSLITKTTYR